jgi:hypothetical protein
LKEPGSNPKNNREPSNKQTSSKRNPKPKKQPNPTKVKEEVESLLIHFIMVPM